MKIARRNIRPGYFFERRIGFEPTNTDFADRPLKPLGHLLMVKIVGEAGVEPTVS